jgi:2,5-furandicarboxylate decarboxylase 1
MKPALGRSEFVVPSASDVDCERFRLRKFVELLGREGELEIVDDRIDLVDVGARLDGNVKAVLFRLAGPEGAQLVGNVAGARRRLALAFGVSDQDLLQEVLRRLEKPIAPVEVRSEQAPVHQVVWTGDAADFTKLPVHLQHGFDGGIYISASIDISQSPDGKRRNVGYRRLMIRGRKEAGVDLLAPSDLRVAYGKMVEAKKSMPIAFVIGSHPTDSITAVSLAAIDDEISLMGGLRGQAVPLVKCITNDVMVPADAEIVLEGYLDEKGWREPEGPFGEYLGYYGQMKTNPVFHLTAITQRRDALFQTATISGRYLGQTDTAQLCALRTEVAVWTALKTAIREPIAIYCPATTGGMFNLRLSMRSRYPGEVRNAIAAVHGSNADVKNVFVVDDDIDVFSDAEMEWAFATRFQPDRDLVTATGFRTIPLDPSLLGSRTGQKAGFDLTFPIGWKNSQEFRIPAAPVLETSVRQSVRAALESGPKFFRQLMEATGSRDGRDTTLSLDELRQEGVLGRNPDGAYLLQNQTTKQS